ATDVGPREMAVANEPLTQPIAIRTTGELKTAPVLATSIVAPHATPEQAAEHTVSLALAEPVKASAPVVPARTAPAAARTARQTAPVITGRMVVADRPVFHVREGTSRTERSEDLLAHRQPIPARLSHAERRPAQDDAFAAAFGNSDAEIRLPEPAYGRPDPQPQGQASAELPPLKLSAAQIHSDPAGTSDADAPPAPPPATASGIDDLQPKS
ncbi:MAG: hypothetical protein ACHQIO_17975, partial [Nevskiales bacterium]